MIMPMDCYQKTTCRLCESTRLTNVLSLTPTPPGNHFVLPKDSHREQPRYPLGLNFCNACGHVQLTHCVDPVVLYQTDYSYVSSTSPVFVNHLRQYEKEITTQYPIGPGSLILDIGSNDGTALGFFKSDGFRTLGIDPAREVVEIATSNGIETICDFFSLELAQRLSDRYGTASLINSHNACAHIDDLSGVFQGVKHWLADDGVFVMEVGYFYDVYEKTWFDTIYHEHVDYHTLGPLIPFFRKHGLEVIHAERISPQGGSLRVVSQKIGGPHPIRKSVEEIIGLERRAGLNRRETFDAFASRIETIRRELGALIAGITAKGETIAGFGAPTKATTLLSHFRLGSTLDFLVDENPLKQNLLSPGDHIPVLEPRAIYERRPDYLLILAWNFAVDIMHRYRAYLQQGGKFILPMPRPVIITSSAGE